MVYYPVMKRNILLVHVEILVSTLNSVKETRYKRKILYDSISRELH